MKRLMVAIILLILGTGVSVSLAQDDDPNAVQTLTYDGLERTYVVHVPERYDPDEATGLVVALHPYGNAAQLFRISVTFDQIANETGDIVVYPNAINAQWSYLDIPIEAGGEVIDDLGFIGALVETVSGDYNIDADRVYATGYSNGGLMALRLRCSAPETFAAVAVVAATMTYGLAQECLESAPLPLMIVLGTEDETFPWAGSAEVESGFFYSTFSVEQTIGFMTSVNGCDGEGLGEEITAEGSALRVLRQSYTECPDGAPFVLLGILGLNHTWPTQAQVLLQDAAVGSIEASVFEFFGANVRGGMDAAETG
jgi:polyhydroxybutyrate depolymerase